MGTVNKEDILKALELEMQFAFDQGKREIKEIHQTYYSGKHIGFKDSIRIIQPLMNEFDTLTMLNQTLLDEVNRLNGENEGLRKAN